MTSEPANMQAMLATRFSVSEQYPTRQPRRVIHNTSKTYQPTNSPPGVRNRPRASPQPPLPPLLTSSPPTTTLTPTGPPRNLHPPPRHLHLLHRRRRLETLARAAPPLFRARQHQQPRHHSAQRRRSDPRFRRSRPQYRMVGSAGCAAGFLLLYAGHGELRWSFCLGRGWGLWRGMLLVYRVARRERVVVVVGGRGERRVGLAGWELLRGSFRRR